MLTFLFFAILNLALGFASAYYLRRRLQLTEQVNHIIAQDEMIEEPCDEEQSDDVEENEDE